MSASSYSTCLITVTCVSPHCVHMFCVMQVTAGMHIIRAFKAEKQQKSDIKMGEVALAA